MIKPNVPTWCPGCGNFGIWTAFQDAAKEQNWDNTNSVVMAGVGCHGHIVNFLNMTAFEGLHGRALPVASGIKMSNQKLNVFVFSGDGDCLSEGGNHFIHTCRRNHNITLILHDNAVYGLTTGQTSPRSPKGFKSKSTPSGNIDEPLHPLLLALASGATFLARTYSGYIDHVKRVMIEANKHVGISIIEVMQPCVTFNKDYTHIFFQENCYFLEDTYDNTNKIKAFEKLMEWGPKQIPLGVIYKQESKSLEQQLPRTETQISLRDISELYSKYR